jgi:Flp pilus assembly protein TadD
MYTAPFGHGSEAPLPVLDALPSRDRREWSLLGNQAAWLLLCCSVSASPNILHRADELYQRTDYAASLYILSTDPSPNAETFALSGKNYFMLGDYKKAVELFEKALALAPKSSEYQLWLGRSYGRRAETGSWILAASNASKARQCFEAAVMLDPHNHEAVNDLFDYYLNAPGLLGGGLDKAEAMARRIENERPPEYHFEMAQLAERRKQPAAAEAHLRAAMTLAPREVGRVLDLARYLAKRGRTAESDSLFAQAAKANPDDPRVAFARAKAYIESHCNREEARKLLLRYLESKLTPDDPPHAAAEKLLRQIAGE